jgi:beta-glucosidase
MRSRFGVLHVDYATQKRTMKHSAELIAKFLEERNSNGGTAEANTRA